MTTHPLVKTALAATALVLALVAPRSARPAHAAPAAAPPEGSYQKSCTHIRLSADGKTLNAVCRTRKGTTQETSLADLAACTDAVRNIDGELHCNKGAVPPAGAYGGSCRDIWLDQGTLHASCDDGSGHQVANQLADIPACASSVANVFGHLTCPKGGKPPQGTYTKTCWDIVVAGDSVKATCRAAGGKSRDGQITALAECRGTPRNVDGYLTCDHGTADPPPGSYHRSCVEITRTGNALAARCENAAGDLVDAGLPDVTACASVANHDGKLACAKGH